jgi:hypothetical protein
MSSPQLSRRSDRVSGEPPSKREIVVGSWQGMPCVLCLVKEGCACTRLAGTSGVKSERNAPGRVSERGPLSTPFDSLRAGCTSCCQQSEARRTSASRSQAWESRGHSAGAENRCWRNPWRPPVVAGGAGRKSAVLIGGGVLDRVTVGGLVRETMAISGDPCCRSAVRGTSRQLIIGMTKGLASSVSELP